MKATGIVRKVDELGRVVIPIELRRTLGIGEKDALEIYVDNERIVLSKYEPGCRDCKETGVQLFGQAQLCQNCIDNLHQQSRGE